MSDWSAPALRGLCGSFLGIATIFVGLRCYTRVQRRVGFLADDWFMLAAWLTYLGASICILLEVHIQYFGYSTWSITPQHRTSIAKPGQQLEVSAAMILTALLAFTKLSALFLYKRVFDVPGPDQRTFQAIVWTSIVIVACWFVTFEFLTGFQCGTHFSSLWNFATHNKYCGLVYPYNYGFVVSDVILDAWVIALPIPWVMRLHMSKNKKLGLVGLFLLALAGLGASLARMVAWIQLNHVGRDAAEKSDPLRAVSRIFFYFMLESGMSIVAINLPVVSSLMFRTFSDTLVHGVRGFMSSLTSIVSRSTQHSTGSDPSRQDSNSETANRTVEIPEKIEQMEKERRSGSVV